MESYGAVTRKMAEFIVGLDLSKLPSSVTDRAKICTMDTLGVMLGGLDARESSIVRDVVKLQGGVSESTVFGGNFKAPASQAAFANCFAANILDMEDGHDLGGHPGSPVVPAALAVAEAVGASGKEFLEATVAGYEVVIRALDVLTAGYRGNPGRGPLPSTGQPFHCTGTGGAFGAAAAAAKLYGLDLSQTAEALCIAGAYAPSTRPKQGPAKGPMEKEGIGWAGKVGIESAIMAKHGFIGPTTVFDDDHGRPTSIGTIGKTFEILNLYFKPYPACRYTHSAVDAVAALLAESGLSGRTVSRLVVKCSKSGLALNSARPSSIVQAQFSFPFVLGAVLAYGRHSLATMTEASLHDEAILKEAKKVHMEHDPSLDSLGWAAGVVLETADGRRFQMDKITPKGDPKDPMSKGDLTAKFLELSGSVLLQESAQRLLNLIMDMENLSDVRKLTNLMSLAGKSSPLAARG